MELSKLSATLRKMEKSDNSRENDAKAAHYAFWADNKNVLMVTAASVAVVTGAWFLARRWGIHSELKNMADTLQSGVEPYIEILESTSDAKRFQLVHTGRDILKDGIISNYAEVFEEKLHELKNIGNDYYDDMQKDAYHINNPVHHFHSVLWEADANPVIALSMIGSYIGAALTPFIYAITQRNELSEIVSKHINERVYEGAISSPEKEYDYLSEGVLSFFQN